MTVLDRGFQYGDGLFETLRVTGGSPQFWQAHLDRLFTGCDRLKIPRPDETLLAEEARQVCRHRREGVLKLMVTRGAGGRGYAVSAENDPTRVVALFPTPDYSEDYWNNGIVVRMCETRLGLNPALAGIKHLNRLEQVMARAEWNEPEIQEGLMRDSLGYVTEGTMSNVYCVKDNVIITPELSRCGIKGIIRDQVFLIARRLGIQIDETNITPETLYDADEVFVSNSVIGIWPVRQLEKHQYSVGPISRQLLEKINNNKHGIDNVA